jgi:Tol biopolymer transport system component
MQQHSTPGAVLGTVGYMSPEQAQGRLHEIDHRSDIFSFGCILYEAITHRKAFEGKDAIDSLNKIIREQPVPIATIVVDASADLQRIVRRCLAKDPDERYQTIKDVAIELKELRRELRVDEGIHTTVPPSLSVTSATTGTLDSDRASAGAASGGLSPTLSTQPSSAEYIVSGIKQHRFAAAIFAGLLVLAVVAIGIGFYKFVERNKAAPPLQARKITRLTNSGKVGNATISPDGKYVAYSALDEAGQSSLWVKYVATGSNVQIVPPAGPDVIFGQSTFSPDGNYIYYLRNVTAGVSGALYQVPVLGGTSKKLLENVSRISFSPDGKRFAFVRRYLSEAEDAIIIVSADGTGEQKLATRTFPDFFLPGAAWSPDGKTIACQMGGFTGGYYRSVAVVQIADGTQRPLTPHKWLSVERVAWLADGSGVITTAQEQPGGPYQIWRIAYPEGEARTITNDLGTYHNVSLTADSSVLVAVLSDQTSNIWVAPTRDWAGALQLTSGKDNGGLSGGTTWAPDGRIVYRSLAGGNPDIWIMDADGRNQKQLTDDASYEESLSVTPDGRHVVFDSIRSGAIQLWRIDIDGSNLKQLTTKGGGAWQPVCSPDGQWVVYTTFGAGGFSIWKVPIDGGEPVPITDKYAFHPAFSPDGKLIACYLLDQQARLTKVALLPSEGGDPVKLFDLPQGVIVSPPFVHPVRWTHDGRALTYIVTRGLISNIWLQPVDGGAPSQLTDFKTDRIFSFDWSRDGKWLAWSRGVIDNDVVLISNFR